MKPAVFGVTGWKNSGKTTLVERLVSELTARGYSVSTVKHAHHQFDIDQEGTDSYRHRAAGATEVFLVSGYRWALMHELRGDDELTLAETLSRLSPCDLVIIEGYKREDHPKIEARRSDSRRRDPLCADDPNILAIASDHPVSETHLPVFDLNDIALMANFIIGHCRLEVSRDAP